MIGRRGLVACGVRILRFLLPLLLVGMAGQARLQAQMSEEEKKRLFLEAREDIRPVPRATATPRPKPKPASTPTPRPAPRETPDEAPPPRATPTPRPVPPSPTPRPTTTPRATPPVSTPRPTPPPKKETPPPPSGGEDFIHLPEDAPKRPAATPTPAAERPTVQVPSGKTPGGHRIDAPISIEKSGRQEDRGYEPPAKQGLGGLFKRWRYLTPATRRAIDQAKVKRGRWKYIIIHNSGTRQGNARVFDVYHRRVRKMQNGMAYHFVIGNGNSSGDGEIEIGSRWTRQINGGHVASDYLNDISIGICLVGDLNRDKPTKAQLAALDELISYLRGRVGRVQGKQAIVRGHKEINPKPTDCPGDRFPLRWLRERFR